ncbi:MAG TPA: GAF domain-containing sensor histidine kinase [Geminicoccus sp.]|jgi:signal transduction histidine kinase|uniref:sensor histidine kinase n=1 Tax=Geminicoccus sp. TaxID=2024832 RepID=UPI002E31ED4B|nr:GAF domain-containing sensor histidine kinase [Geminicoccus sp.]HEX2527282.1 GAF domain-containing sensor histidine kinase [Geminicoccus sp.]
MDPAIARDVAKVEQLTAVPTILRLVSEITGLRFVAVARVTPTSWTACAVLDQVEFGLKSGDPLEVNTTFCKEICNSHRPIVIEKASEDEIYCRHPTPKMYGFESYLAVPIILGDGQVFGTICALDPLPASLRDKKILPTVELFAQLLGAQLQVEDQLSESRFALANATEAALLREQFIALLGHDLRNPLFSLISGLRLLSMNELDERGTFVLDQMQQSCARMGKLIDDVLDFARGRLGGGISIDRRPVEDLAEQLSTVIEENRETQPDRRIDVEIAVEGSVSCDPARLGQLLSNLMAGAMSCGARGQPVEVAVRLEDDTLTMIVANRDAVVAPDVLAQFFQPHPRTSQGPARTSLGLGLYLAAEIARGHGGELSATSTPGEGTVFAFRCSATQAR